LVWGVVFGVLIVMLARGAQMGFSGMIAIANNSGAVTQQNWEESARSMGYSQTDINRARDALGNVPAQASNLPSNREVVESNATRAAWYSFLGTLASMLAAVVGGVVGAGPTLRILTFRVDRAGATFDRRDTYVRPDRHGR
jgi:hypothetical protein